MRVLTWHVHGSYLWYLSSVPVDWYLPVKDGRPEGYGGRGRPGARNWPDNVHEVDAAHVAGPDFEVDKVLYQSHRNWLVDRHELHTDRFPGIFLEHDPPRESPTDTRHPVQDGNVLIVHCTPFNQLMWDCGDVPTTVIDHGVDVGPATGSATYELDRGLVIVNGLATRGRRLGRDVFEQVRRRVPLDLVGMGSEELGGLGEVPPPELPQFAARYRFLFNPIRYTSLGLAVLEAMATGLPVVGLATTEMATAVKNGVSGYVDTDVERLVEHMVRLIDDPAEAARLGAGARQAAAERFGIDRFVRDWEKVLL